MIANNTIDQVFSREMFFVCGAPKSGTTWLQRLVDAHPEIQCSGEGHFFDRLSHELAKVFRGYNDQQAIVAERVYEGKPYYQGIDQSIMDHVVQSLVALMMGQRTIDDRVKCIGDKTPRYTEYLATLWRIFPDAKVIHIVRDPRDVVTSSLHHRLRAGYQDALDKTAPDYLNVIASISQSWVESIAKATAQGERHPEQYHLMRYEDLHQNSVASLQAVLDFLTVSSTTSDIESCLAAADFNTLSGRANGKENKQSFFRKGIVGDWQNVIGQQGDAVIRQYAQVWMQKFGYVE